MGTYEKRIKDLHEKFNIDCKMVEFTHEEKVFRVTAMQEELNEYIDAKTPVDEFDALIDLIVFALGTVERQGLLDVFKEGFDRVMDANMTKVMRPLEKRNNFALNLAKPEGFKPPVLDDLITERTGHPVSLFDNERGK